MKKKILIGFAALVIAAVAALNVNFSTNGYKLSDISLANVEALANGEVVSGCCPCPGRSAGSLRPCP